MLAIDVAHAKAVSGCGSAGPAVAHLIGSDRGPPVRSGVGNLT